MVGSAFISHDQGWACSNAVTFDVEKDIRDTPEGPRSFQTNTLKIKGLFNAKGVIEKDFLVDCVFKADDDNKLRGFAGQITGQLKDLTVVKLLAKYESVDQILKKIKEEN